MRFCMVERRGLLMHFHKQGVRPKPIWVGVNNLEWGRVRCVCVCV